MHMVLMLDRCQSHGNDQLSNFNTLETTCLHSHTALTISTISRGGENQCIMLHKTWLLTLSQLPPCWNLVPACLEDFWEYLTTRSNTSNDFNAISCQVCYISVCAKLWHRITVKQAVLRRGEQGQRTVIPFSYSDTHSSTCQRHAIWIHLVWIDHTQHGRNAAIWIRYYRVWKLTGRAHICLDVLQFTQKRNIIFAQSQKLTSNVNCQLTASAGIAEISSC